MSTIEKGNHVAYSDTLVAANSRCDISAEEFGARVALARAEAWARGLDGLVVWSKGGGTLDHYANVVYLTNHYSVFPDIPDQAPYWVGHSNVAAVVPCDGDLVLVSDVPVDEEIVVADRIEVAADVPAAVGAAIQASGLAGRRVGFVGASAITLERWRLLKAACPEIDWCPADDLLSRIRSVKSEAEVAVIRDAVRVGDAVIGAMFDSATPGASEAEIAAAGYQTAMRQGATLLDLPAASGPDAEHFARGTAPSWTTRRLAPGDIYHSDMYGAYHGYFFDFARTTVVGQDPDDAQRALIEGAIAAVDAGVQALHPGSTFGDAYRTAAAALEGTEIQMAFPSFGHNLGLGIESPWLTPNNPAVIVSNMHVAVEAIVTVAGIGTAVHEENVLVTPDGPEVLSTVSVRPWT